MSVVQYVLVLCATQSVSVRHSTHALLTESQIQPNAEQFGPPASGGSVQAAWH
jgi:hypothetical protein